MRAATHTSYGPPEVITITDIEKPSPKDNELLIRVHATTVNRTDTGFRSAEYFISRFFSGLFKPKNQVLGCEFAGEVVEVGTNVKKFKPGDRVFGFDDIGWGGHAEYKVIPEDKMITTVPKGFSYQDMAAATEGSHYSLFYLRAANVSKGDDVLVNGGTGAIGSAAIQLLKSMDINVTATSNTKNLKIVKSLGADRVIDYKKKDFTKDSAKYDMVFDAVGKSSFKKCKPLLKERGFYASTELGDNAQNPFLALWTKPFHKKKVLFPIPSNKIEDLEFIKQKMIDRQFKPLIDHISKLENIIEESRYAETGEKVGNIVLLVD